MKKIYTNLLTIAAMSGLAVIQVCARGTYLQNNANYQIEYVRTTPIVLQYSQPGTYPIKKMGNGYRVELELLPHLSVRTIGGSWVDLSHKLTEVMHERRNHGDDDAVIYIVPGYIYGWTVRIEWEKPSSMK